MYASSSPGREDVFCREGYTRTLDFLHWCFHVLYPDFEKKSSSITLLSPTADVGLAAARDRPSDPFLYGIVASVPPFPSRRRGPRAETGKK
ncbi:hypothetical protein V6N13_036575 [Hibiscus sabdariffa]|uniref:Uncharacterized protein n=1 Tax=Hibiscus sabdariffa TaxID=183260 RepID=A0ABR2S5Z7_9ROSI